ncbi:hypothetical protein JOF28_001956 [Leucobacter exalbidus]|uniref:Uncharacterized protein n=1 Tax=Leucobacter exalbidus TaxID=662960 RepID=A0A940PWQ0_9MICO|nr:hypothetical protein [Leucobacter exalbidus]MBP1326724.1 hypothetical protein [Leucobacter exalbidus]
MKRRPANGTQARILTELAKRLDTYDDPAARARAAGIRGRLPDIRLMSHKAARQMAVDAAMHLQELEEDN